MPFSDYQTALVTGANTGMGAAITEMLTKQGLTVYGRRPRRRQARRAREPHRHDALCAVDLTDTAALAAAVGDLAIDVLVNNAGRLGAPATSSTRRRPRSTRMVDVNLRAVLHLCGSCCRGWSNATAATS